MPKARTINDIKSNILQPATTSHFEVTIPLPNERTFRNFLNSNGVSFDLDEQERLNLLCSEAILPGSSLATLELDNAYRRVFDDRIDLTFYVDAKNYLPIKFFETWVKYISGEQIAENNPRGKGIRSGDYFYRMQYPNTYVSDQGLKVIKFEKDFGSTKGGKTLQYTFVRSFPISVASMPISYDSSSLLKCTVSLTYIRYYIESLTGIKPPAPPVAQTTPAQQAAANTAKFSTFGNTAGPNTVFTERDTATGARLDGGSDPQPITARQALGLN
jgi:hypothetical protein